MAYLVQEGGVREEPDVHQQQDICKVAEIIDCSSKCE